MQRSIAAITSAAALALALPAGADEIELDDNIRVASPHSVEDTVERLTAAIEEAGASVAAEVDHAAAAESIGAELAPMTMVMFGNPEIGTPVLQANPTAGMELPLRVVVYEDGAGDTWLAYEDPAAMAERHVLEGVDDSIEAMAGALDNLTAAAAAQD